MTERIELLETALKNAGHSLTKPRRIIFETLTDSEPVSMHELIITCRGRIDRASIYRTVRLFEKIHVIQRLQAGWKYKIELSDHFAHHHHHMTCLQCGNLFPLPSDCALEEQLLLSATSAGFFPHDHQIEIRGYCKTCQKSDPTVQYATKKVRE